MPAISRKVGDVSQKIPVFVPDATVSTGAGLANINATSVSFGWWRDDMAAVSTGTCTTGTLGTYGVSSFVQLNSTNALGWYQFCPPDTALSAGKLVMLHLYGAPSMAPVPLLIDLSTQASAVSTPVGVSTVTIPLSVSSGVVSVSSATIPFGVSSGVIGVSSATISFGVSSLSTPVSVSSNADKAGYGVSSVSIPLGVSSGSIEISSMTAAAAAIAADKLLGRNVSGGADTGRMVKEALYVLRNKVDAGLGIVYATDDTTSSWAFSVSTVAGNPIQVIDPA